MWQETIIWKENRRELFWVLADSKNWLKLNEKVIARINACLKKRKIKRMNSLWLHKNSEPNVIHSL